MIKRKLLVVPLLSLLASTAYAVDAKVHAGANCAPLFSGLGHYAFVEGFVATQGLGGDEATCPIVRDNTSNVNGLTDLEMNLTAGDPGTAICVANSRSASGASLIAVTRSRTTSGKLDWANSVNSSGSKGSYAIRCDIPAWWIINNYFSDEP